MIHATTMSTHEPNLVVVNASATSVYDGRLGLEKAWANVMAKAFRKVGWVNIVDFSAEVELETVEDGTLVHATLRFELAA